MQFTYVNIFFLFMGKRLALDGSQVVVIVLKIYINVFDIINRYFYQIK